MGVPIRWSRNSAHSKKPPRRDRVLERRPIHEDIRGPLAFTRPRRPSGPAAAQPEVRILRHEFRGDRALAGPTGADEHEDARLASGRFSAQSL